jgi:hypothetical protein
VLSIFHLWRKLTSRFCQCTDQVELLKATMPIVLAFWVHRCNMQRCDTYLDHVLSQWRLKKSDDVLQPLDKVGPDRSCIWDGMVEWKRLNTAYQCEVSL